MKTLTNSSEKPPNGDKGKHMRDLEAYKKGSRKDYFACFTMLSSMLSNRNGQFEVHTTAKGMREAV